MDQYHVNGTINEKVLGLHLIYTDKDEHILEQYQTSKNKPNIQNKSPLFIKLIESDRASLAIFIPWDIIEMEDKTLQLIEEHDRYAIFVSYLNENENQYYVIIIKKLINCRDDHLS